MIIMVVSLAFWGCSKSDTSEVEKPADTSQTATAVAESGGISDLEGKTVTIFIPGKAGGGSDLTTRYLIQTWGEKTGIKFKPVNYDTTVSCYKSLMGKKADGLTLSLAHTSIATQYVTGATGIHPLNDVTLVGHIGNNGLRTIAVPSDAPYDTFEDFLSYMKANPGKVKAGISPNGTTQFLMGTLENKLGLQFNYVEASAETDRLTGLAGGFIDVGTISLGNGMEYEKAGKLKVLATVGANGSKITDFTQEAPAKYQTLQEQGYEDVYAVTNYYVVAPEGMDSALVEALNESLQRLMDSGSAYIDGMDSMGQVAEWHDLEESKAILADELETLTDVAKSLGIYNL